MLIEKLKKLDSPTAQDSAIIEFILKEPYLTTTMTARELAKETYTSASAVIRLCQKVGEDGFSSFKRRLLTELTAQKNGLYAPQSGPLIEQGMPIDRLTEHCAQFYRRITYETQKNLTQERLLAVRSLILQADTVEIYGTGINYSIAQNAAFKLQSIGISCFALDEVNVQNLSFSGSGYKKRTAILISHTGENPSMIRTARVLKGKKIPVIALCETEESTLGKEAGVFVPIVNMDGLTMLAQMSYPLSCSFVFDMIYMSLLTLTLNSQFPETAKEFYSRLVSVQP